MPKKNRCHDSDHIFGPIKENGLGPFSLKFFVPIRVFFLLKIVSSLLFFSILHMVSHVFMADVGHSGQILSYADSAWSCCCCCCCCFSHSAHWLPTRKKLLYTVANPARGLLNREKKKKKKSGSAPPPPPPPARCSFGEKIKIKVCRQ